MATITVTFDGKEGPVERQTITIRSDGKETLLFDRKNARILVGMINETIGEMDVYNADFFYAEAINTVKRHLVTSKQTLGTPALCGMRPDRFWHVWPVVGKPDPDYTCIRCQQICEKRRAHQ